MPGAASAKAARGPRNEGKAVQPSLARPRHCGKEESLRLRRYGALFLWRPLCDPVAGLCEAASCGILAAVETLVHGTCVALGGSCALLRGLAGRKSDLALRFLFLPAEALERAAGARRRRSSHPAAHRRTHRRLLPATARGQDRSARPRDRPACATAGEGPANAHRRSGRFLRYAPVPGEQINGRPSWGCLSGGSFSIHSKCRRRSNWPSPCKTC